MLFISNMGSFKYYIDFFYTLHTVHSIQSLFHTHLIFIAEGQHDKVLYQK